jgi:hypothetical protein
MDLSKITFKNAVSVSKETHYISIVKILSREIIC